MKKLLLGLMLLSTNAYANTIAVGTVSSDISVVNNNFSTIATVINGVIEGSTDGGATVSNVKADSLYEINMADDANPRLRDSELLSVTTDSVAVQNAYVYSGGVPADSANLTSDISACVAYINGYRVSKAATSTTYTASRDNWVDLSQTGVYTVTAVTVGAAEPVVAANSARLAKVTTDATEITAVTDEANRRLPGLIIPSQYRTGLVVSRDSATTLTVQPGSCEINNTMIPKTAITTLTITTAGDWAGGSALNAANTFGFVGSDASGNLKLHTTAPTHDNYGVSTTVGKRRYATWSSTVYRILGWFYMGTATTIDWASNIKEGDVANIVVSNDTAVVATSGAAFQEVGRARFYSSGGNILVMGVVSGDSTGAFDYMAIELNRAGTTIPGSGSGGASTAGATQMSSAETTYLDINRPQGTSYYSLMARTSGNALNMRRRSTIVSEQ